jgi:ATP-binding cassette subfamily F protein uup
MEKEQADIFEKMASPDFYKTDGAEIARIKARHDELEHLLEKAFARWEALEAKNC